MAPIKPPAVNPCGSCPYRRDVPSGVWSEEEYRKLPEYDKPTSEQPPKVFMCHQQDGRLCAGWTATHDMTENFGLRFVSLTQPDIDLDAIMNYTTKAPLFDSGEEACEHGLQGVAEPQPEAIKLVDKLRIKQERRESQ